MFRTRFVCLLLAFVCAFCITGTALAAQVDCDATYCFTSADFSQDDSLQGICITHLPNAQTGTVMLGSRVIRSGDILTAEQLTQMTFMPLRTEENQDAIVTYLPIYQDRVETSATMTISVMGKEDKKPVAEDFSMETYKNIPNQGTLKVSDPEGEALTYTLVRQPKRGTVTIEDNGQFVYTPKKNKVGVDSFTYTATDPAGNVSREATVTIQILKPTSAEQYTDTAGSACRFAAEWMRNPGLFVGEKVGGEICFQPEKAVSRGEFLAMAVKMLDIPMENDSYAGVPADTPQWLRPYYAAALRSGLIAGWPEAESGAFGADQPITGAEAAVMLQNALGLSVSSHTLDAVETGTVEGKEDAPAWAANSLTVMADNGICLSATQSVTRGEVAQILYQAHQLSQDAPGMAVIRMQH